MPAKQSACSSRTIGEPPATPIRAATAWPYSWARLVSSPTRAVVVEQDRDQNAGVVDDSVLIGAVVGVAGQLPGDC